MKKLLLSIVTIALLASCSKQGEISKPPRDFIEINNKVYKLMKVVPCDNCKGIWIMYPKDSTDNMPQSLNWEYSQSNGKSTSTYTETLIKVD